MRMRKAVIPILILINLLVSACKYIVLPAGLDIQSSVVSKGWSAVVTGVSQSATGDLHVDLTIRNETAEWSMMKAVEDKPATLTTQDGKNHPCETVFVGTGGHRLAPGFQMRGYTGGTKLKPEIQLLYVECAGASAATGSKLAIDYVSYSGDLNYYQQENGEAKGTLKLNLDEIAADLTYPVFESVEGLIRQPDLSILALSENVINLLDVQRTQDGFEFKWQNTNPTEFALKIHIGNPPVIGSDGIIYGWYQIMDLATTPITPSGGTTEWSTTAAVPVEVTDCYILLSVESKNMRLYVNYAIDITDK